MKCDQVLGLPSVMSPTLDTPYQCLFDESADTGISLPPEIQADYGGDWALPQPADGVYSYSNFVVSHDGRISFNEPGHYGGDHVSGGNRYDTWLMALLRARADAVMVGDNTLTLEPEHLWTHQYIFPETSEYFGELRQLEGRSPYPLQVFLSMDGKLNWNAAVFMSGDQHVVIATTQRGAATIADEMRGSARVDVIAQDERSVNLHDLQSELRNRYGVQTLLIEGGPRAYASALADRIIVDEFLTLSPIVVGNDAGHDRIRPGLIEGMAFSPDDAIRMRPLSLRRNGSYLFLKSRVVYPEKET